MLAIFQSVWLIFWTVITPIFTLVGVGYVVQKRLGLDAKTLTRLNFWIFVPAFLFVRIYESQLSGAQLKLILLHFALFFPLIGVLTWILGGFLGFPDRLRRALTASVMFYNSGNYGIPVAQLAFPGAILPLQVQAAIVMMQNISNFTVGLLIIAGGKGRGRRETLREIFKLPMIYVLALAWTMRYFQIAPPAPIFVALHWLDSALVPVAVITLGAQMAALKIPRFNRVLTVSLGLRLILAPILGFGIAWMLGIRGELAQALTLSTAFPTAVNAALLAAEFDNEPEFAAAAVFYSTLFSTVTVSVVIFLTQFLV